MSRKKWIAPPKGCRPLGKDAAENTERGSGEDHVIVGDPGLPGGVKLSM